MIFFNIPLIAYVCWSLLQRCFGHNFRSHLHQGKYSKIAPVHLLMLLLYTWQVYSCYFLHVTYGSLAFILSPLRTWLALLTPVLIYRVWTLNSTELGIFMVHLKSHLSSWSPWLTASSLEEVQPPHLWPRFLPQWQMEKPVSVGELQEAVTPWTSECWKCLLLIPAVWTAEKSNDWFFFRRQRALIKEIAPVGSLCHWAPYHYCVYYGHPVKSTQPKPGVQVVIIYCLGSLWKLVLDLYHSWDLTSQPVFPRIVGFLLP